MKAAPDIAGLAVAAKAVSVREAAVPARANS